VCVCLRAKEFVGVQCVNKGRNRQIPRDFFLQNKAKKKTKNKGKRSSLTEARARTQDPGPKMPDQVR
jgi:hypothetical protein